MTGIWKWMLESSHPGLPDAAVYVQGLRRYCREDSAHSDHGDTGEPDRRPLAGEGTAQAGLSSQTAAAGIANFCVGIVGAGWMGSTIAALLLRHGHGVTLQDVQPQALHTAPQRIAQDCLAAGWGEDETRAILRRLRLSEELGDVRDCDIVLECVVEDEAVKRDLLMRLEALLRPDAVLASNTSGISLTVLASGLSQPDRFLGLHFLHPVRERSLVEVIRGPATAPKALRIARELLLGLDRLPLEVRNGPGFAVNRLLFPFLSEALHMLRQGFLPHEVDALIERCGWLGGPCKIIDEIGIDTTFRVGRVLWQAFPDRVAPSPILVTLLKRHRLGRKGGGGFYRYTNTVAWSTPPLRDEACEEWIRSWWELQPDARPPEVEVVRRVVLGMMLEGFRLLADGVVGDPRAVDAAAVLGLGFPERWGGPCRLAHAIGESALFQELAALDGQSPSFAMQARTEAIIRRLLAQAKTVDP